MVNFDGTIYPPDTPILTASNRGLRFGDALFEAIRVIDNKVIFWEDHYLRLMASMRILRMEIPMDFTMEFLETEILRTPEKSTGSGKPTRIRLTVFRKGGGRYLPQTNDISYLIEASQLEEPFFTIGEGAYEVELFKDFYINPGMLSTLKTAEKLVHITASIYASENDYDNCLLLNHNKQVVEAINGNLFLVKDGLIKTPPLADGCLNGITRKKIIEICRESGDLTLEETSVSAFELQQADEMFITNAIQGITPVSRYRKARYSSTVATKLLGKLNAWARIK